MSQRDGYESGVSHEELCRECSVDDRGWSVEQHFDQEMPWEWRAFELDDELLIVHSTDESTPDAYRVEKTTRNPRVMAAADAVLYKGVVTQPFYDENIKSVCLHHFYAAEIESFFVEEWLDEPVVVLEALKDHGAQPIEVAYRV